MDALWNIARAKQDAPRTIAPEGIQARDTLRLLAGAADCPSSTRERIVRGVVSLYDGDRDSLPYGLSVVRHCMQGYSKGDNSRPDTVSTKLLRRCKGVMKELLVRDQELVGCIIAKQWSELLDSGARIHPTVHRLIMKWIAPSRQLTESSAPMETDWIKILSGFKPPTPAQRAVKDSVTWVGSAWRKLSGDRLLNQH